MYLSHHGIQGQKWGVRRYQNKDGSFTPAGRERYSHGLETPTFRDRKHGETKNDYKARKANEKALFDEYKAKQKAENKSAKQEGRAARNLIESYSNKQVTAMANVVNRKATKLGALALVSSLAAFPIGGYIGAGLMTGVLPLAKTGLSAANLSVTGEYVERYKKATSVDVPARVKKR